MRLYGLPNGGRLQIRRAVNQTSKRTTLRSHNTRGPHGVSIVCLPALRPIKYWVHSNAARVLDGDVSSAIRTPDLSSRLFSRRGEKASRRRAVYHERIKCVLKRNNDPSCGNTWENTTTTIVLVAIMREKKGQTPAATCRVCNNGTVDFPIMSMGYGLLFFRQDARGVGNRAPFDSRRTAMLYSIVFFYFLNYPVLLEDLLWNALFRSLFQNFNSSCAILSRVWWYW